MEGTWSCKLSYFSERLGECVVFSFCGQRLNELVNDTKKPNYFKSECFLLLASAKNSR